MCVSFYAPATMRQTKKPLSEAPLSFSEKEILKIAVKKVKGTDIELLLKESEFIE